jgi:DsbC/DsbD-like thiol-disulfide interchange protein
MKTLSAQFRRHSVLFGSLAFGLAMPVHLAGAASSQWQDLGGGEARLVATKDPETGKLDGIIEVRLKKGWKTYWKSPGGSGIAPEFDFSVSRAASIGEVSYPVPTWITIPDASFYGYKGTVSFPFTGKADSPDSSIHLEMLLGVCEEICIPATAGLEIDAAALNRSDPKAEVAIALAKSHLPTAPVDGFKLNAASLEAKTIRVQGEVDGKNPPKAVIALEGVWISDPHPIEIDENGTGFAVFSVPDFVSKTIRGETTLHYTLLEHDETSAGGKMARAVNGKLNLGEN